MKIPKCAISNLNQDKTIQNDANKPKFTMQNQNRVFQTKQGTLNEINPELLKPYITNG